MVFSYRNATRLRARHTRPRLPRFGFEQTRGPRVSGATSNNAPREAEPWMVRIEVETSWKWDDGKLRMQRKWGAASRDM
jgi:hypothetical protein